MFGTITFYNLPHEGSIIKLSFEYSIIPPGVYKAKVIMWWKWRGVIVVMKKKKD